VFLDLLGFGLVIPLLTFYAEAHGAKPMAVTGLMAVYSGMQFLCAPAWGRLSDRIGRRPVLLWSIGATAVCLAGFALAPSLPFLFLFRALHGAATANIGTAQAALADLTAPEHRARAMGLIGAAFGLGFTAGPALGGLLAQYGLSVPIWVAAALSALNFALAAAWLGETRPPASRPSERSITPSAVLAVLRRPVVGPFVAVTGLLTMSFALMESTFTLFAERAFGLGPTDVGWLFGAAGLTTIVVQGGLVRRLVPRFGERRLVPVGLVVLASALLVLPYAVPGPALWTVFAGMSLGQGLASPSLAALISREAGDEQGFVLGVNQSMAALGRVLGPALGGALFDPVGPTSPFLAAAGLLWVALGTFAARRA
jgi:MFS family permease